MTQTQLAQASGTSQATLSAYERGNKVPSATTLARILAAAGRRLSTRPASRPVITPSVRELENRGRILAQVIELAEALPSKRDGKLAYPVLPSIVATDR
jgi:transcriptional regulator with XRE-family HTH domain